MIPFKESKFVYFSKFNFVKTGIIQKFIKSGIFEDGVIRMPTHSLKPELSQENGHLVTLKLHLLMYSISF